MLNIQNSADNSGRKSLTVQQRSDDGKSYWDIGIVTHDLPAAFLNSQDRHITGRIVNSIESNDVDQPNSMFIPLVLTGVSAIDGQTKYSFKQRFDDAGSAGPIAEISCFVIKDANSPSDVSYDLHELYLQLTFDVSRQDSENRLALRGSSDSGTPMLRIEDGENSNDGIRTPVSTSQQSQERQNQNEDRLQSA